MLAAVLVGFFLPSIDDWLAIDLPLFAFETNDSARSLLETVGTVTVAVAGLAFSVTIVAFTLTASQLSPRVLRTFRSDRLSQITLACFLGTFIYCLVLLVRLDSSDEVAAPNLAMTLAILLAFASFALFAGFISHIVELLQPSAIIAGIADDASSVLRDRFPAGVGGPPEDPAAAQVHADARMARPGHAIRAGSGGYVGMIRGGDLIRAAQCHDAFVVLRVALGDYVLPGDVLADVWCDDGDGREAVTEIVRRAIGLERQRSPSQDIAFPVRQLADIALKGLSPGINDPTTAENAMGALSSILVEFVAEDAPHAMRVDEDGTPRLLTVIPDLDDLVRLGFEQVRVFAAPYPVVAVRMLELLARIRRAASATGVSHAEVERQASLLARGPDGDVPTSADAEIVRSAYLRTHAMPSAREVAGADGARLR